MTRPTNGNEWNRDAKAGFTGVILFGIRCSFGENLDRCQNCSAAEEENSHLMARECPNQLVSSIPLGAAYLATTKPFPNLRDSKSSERICVSPNR